MFLNCNSRLYFFQKFREVDSFDSEFESDKFDELLQFSSPPTCIMMGNCSKNVSYSEKNEQENGW